MNRILFPLLLAFAAGSAFAQSTTATVSETHGKDAASSAASKDTDRYCLRTTGSHLDSHLYAKSRDGRKFDRCVNGNGRVYTREDLERTGASTTADALRSLDPSIH
jgi:hypothetical protein